MTTPPEAHLTIRLEALLDDPDLTFSMVEGTRTRTALAGIDPSEYTAVTRSLNSGRDWPAAFIAAAEGHGAIAGVAIPRRSSAVGLSRCRPDGAPLPAAAITMEQATGDVLAVVDAVGGKRAILAGTSYGGFLTLQVARHASGRVEALVVDSAAASARHPERDRQRACFWEGTSPASRPWPGASARWQRRVPSPMTSWRWPCRSSTSSRGRRRAIGCSPASSAATLRHSSACAASAPKRSRAAGRRSSLRVI